MKLLLTIIQILTLSTTLPAQPGVDSLVLTQEQNERWIVQLEKETKTKQLDLIRERLLLDTNIYIPKYYPDRIKFDNEKAKGNRTQGYGRPLLVFNGHPAYIDNGTETKSIVKLSALLTDDRIKNISIMKDSQATAIYGSRGTCDAILLTTKDKRTFKKIKEINLTPGEHGL